MARGLIVSSYSLPDSGYLPDRRLPVRLREGARRGVHDRRNPLLRIHVRRRLLQPRRHRFQLRRFEPWHHFFLLCPYIQLN